MASAAQAAPPSPYISPTYAALIQTFIGFHAIDFDHDVNLIDDYALITHCDWFLVAHGDEFKWRQVREGLLDQIHKNADQFTTTYRYNTELHLGQYDFTDKYFRFAPHEGVENINAFLISHNSAAVCQKNTVDFLPSSFRAVLKTPVFVHGITMSPEEGEALLKRMAQANNTKRSVYARFNLRITFVPPLVRSVHLVEGGHEAVTYDQGDLRGKDAAQMDAELDSIEFYEDPTMQLLLATYRPN